MDHDDIDTAPKFRYPSTIINEWLLHEVRTF
jgi:hypothetical protein